MRGLILRGRIFLIILSAGLVLNSCKDLNEPTPKNYTWFVSSQAKAQVTVADIQLELQWAKMLFPQVSPLVKKVKSDIDVRKIIYTTTFQNKKINVSGLVYLPKIAGDYPVLCFQNGANTQHSLAPTMTMESDMLYMLESVASMGFIVTVPDYIGFGESEQLPHPFLQASSTVQCTMDMLRAMKEFAVGENIPAKPTKDLFLFGYSQGGWATMLLQKEIETKYSTEFNLKASTCASGPYSLEYMNSYISSQAEYASPYFLAYLLNSYIAIGEISNPLSDFMLEPYAAKIPGLFDGEHSGSSIDAALTSQMSDLLTSDFRTRCNDDPKFTSFRKALKDNSVKVSDWKVSTPTLLFHGAQDNVIPLSMSEQTLLDLKAAGTSDSIIQLVTIPKVGHTDGIIPVGVATILWFLEINK